MKVVALKSLDQRNTRSHVSAADFRLQEEEVCDDGFNIITVTVTVTASALSHPVG